MQFPTTLTPRIPRCSCNRCGVRTISIPWAEKHGHFTLLFDAFAIDVPQASQSIQAAALLLRIDRPTVLTSMKRAVERELARRNLDKVRHIGIAEKRFGAGQDYASVITWSLKELFRCFWQETNAVGRRALIESWYAWAIRSRLDLIRKIARMLKTRRDKNLTWFSSPISNQVAAGFNSQIPSINSMRETSVSLRTIKFGFSRTPAT
jgi:transposase